VSISAEEREHELEIAVRDHGIGIAREHQERIFDGFEQVHRGDNRKYGGSGLGLSISRSLVRMHGGELRVESELGQGATFRLRIPRDPLARVANDQLAVVKAS
jgi:signal transduction histidine kinase